MPVLPVRGLLLDVDDTLLDTASAMVASARQAVAAVWPDADPEVQAAAGERFHADPQGWFTRFTTGELDFAAMRAARVNDLERTFGLRLPGGGAQAFESAYAPVFEASLRAFDDVRPLLEACAGRAVPVGLLTNSSSDYTQRKLQWTGLADRFDVVVTRDTLGYGKPDARVFHRACADLGVAPQSTAYVGDHPVVDAGAARAAGLHGVWLRRGKGSLGGRLPRRSEQPPDGVPVVSSLTELVGLLGWAAAARSAASGFGGPTAAR